MVSSFWLFSQRGLWTGYLIIIVNTRLRTASQDCKCIVHWTELSCWQSLSLSLSWLLKCDNLQVNNVPPQSFCTNATFLSYNLYFRLLSVIFSRGKHPMLIFAYWDVIQTSMTTTSEECSSYSGTKTPELTLVGAWSADIPALTRDGSSFVRIIQLSVSIFGPCVLHGLSDGSCCKNRAICH